MMCYSQDPLKSDIVAVKKHLDTLFTIKDMGYAKYFLGIELARSGDGTFICQKKYIADIIADTHLKDANPADTPMPRGFKFQQDSKPLIEVDQYHRLV